MKSLLICFLILCATPSARAIGGGAVVGDGGHGVECGSGWYELLDFYEARRLYGVEPDFDGYRYSPTFNWSAIETARKRVAEIVPVSSDLKAAFDSAIAIDFSNQTSWGNRVDPTTDSGGMVVPLERGCRLVQLARREKRKHGYAYSFNSDAWDQLDPFDAAALILHEGLHMYFRTEKNTLAIRQFVMFASAPENFRRRNAAAFKTLVETRRAVAPSAFSRVGRAGP